MRSLASDPEHVPLLMILGHHATKSRFEQLSFGSYYQAMRTTGECGNRTAPIVACAMPTAVSNCMLHVLGEQACNRITRW